MRTGASRYKHLLMLMLMLMYSTYPRANLVTKSYDGCAMKVVFSKLQNCADFSDDDFRDGGSALQHMGPETANTRTICDSPCTRRIQIALGCCPQMTTSCGS